MASQSVIEGIPFFSNVTKKSIRKYKHLFCKQNNSQAFRSRMYLREQKRKKMVKSLIILKGQSCGITSVRSSIIPDIKGWVDFNDTPHYFDKPLTYSQYKMFVP